RNKRVAGAIVLGDGVIVPSLLRAFLESTVVTDDRTELLFYARDSPTLPAPEAISDTAQICDCNGVSKAQIIEAVLGGARSVQAVSAATRACTGCGSCKVEVERIVTLACQGVATPDVLIVPERIPDLAPPVPNGGSLVVTLNKIERFKSEKDGLDVL